MAFPDLITMFMLLFVGYHCSIKGRETCFCSSGLECNILMSCAVFPFDTEQERKLPAIV